jgi:acyl carrier protein
VVNEQLDEEITQYLTAFLTSVAVGAAFSEDTRLVEDLGLDSLDFTALLAGLEARWSVTISEEDIAVDRLSTVAAVRARIHSAVELIR